MRKLILICAATAGLTMFGATDSAEAARGRRWNRGHYHHHHGGWNRGYNYYPRYNYGWGGYGYYPRYNYGYSYPYYNNYGYGNYYGNGVYFRTPGFGFYVR